MSAARKAPRPGAGPKAGRPAAGGVPSAAKPNGFPSREHLTGMDFLRVMAKGQKKSCAAFHLYWTPSAEFSAGVVVARRLGGAVERNRIKRVLREAVRLLKSGLEGSHHLVLVARPGAETLDVEQAKASLAELCTSARLLEPAKL